MPEIVQRQILSHEARTYIGGLSWRWWFRATTPSAKLTIEPEGTVVGPSWPRVGFLWRLLGFPGLRARWSEIDTIEVVRTPWNPSPRGVIFVIRGKKLGFSSSAPNAKDIIEELAQYAPEKIARRENPTVVF
jgi:hypothetical protein